VAQEINSVTTV